ncbi:MAG: hypothetical protein WAL56_13730 [Candidatus Sulfotelmatobacter sp.]
MSRARVKLGGLLVAIVVGISALYVFRVPLRTWIWHFRHGTSLTIGDYIVPVPANWGVEGFGDSDQALVRLDTDDQTARKKLKAHAGITLHLSQIKDHDLSLAASLDRDSLKKKGVEPILQRDLKIDGGAIFCVGGEDLGSSGVYDIEPLSWICRSPGGLEIMWSASEPDAKQVWEIVSGIRKKHT